MQYRKCDICDEVMTAQSTVGTYRQAQGQKYEVCRMTIYECTTLSLLKDFMMKRNAEGKAISAALEEAELKRKNILRSPLEQMMIDAAGESSCFRQNFKFYAALVGAIEDRIVDEIFVSNMPDGNDDDSKHFYPKFSVIVSLNDSMNGQNYGIDKPFWVVEKESERAYRAVRPDGSRGNYFHGPWRFANEGEIVSFISQVVQASGGVSIFNVYGANIV